MESPDDAFDSGNLLHVFKCDCIVASAIPSKCDIHVYTSGFSRLIKCDNGFPHLIWMLLDKLKCMMDVIYGKCMGHQPVMR